MLRTGTDLPRRRSSTMLRAIRAQSWRAIPNGAGHPLRSFPDEGGLFMADTLLRPAVISSGWLTPAFTFAPVGAVEKSSAGRVDNEADV